MGSWRNFFIVVISIAFLIIAACTQAPQKSTITIPSAQQKERVTELIRSGWNFKFGKTVNEIKQSLGKPLTEKIEAYKNRHVDGQIDEIHILDYEGLTVYVCRVNEVPPRDLVFRLIITNERFSLKWGLRIGSTRAEVIQLFGQPRETGDNIRYSYKDIEAGDEDSVTFSFSNDRIEKVDWQWYLD